jgi:hypothetical protein
MCQQVTLTATAAATATATAITATGCSNVGCITLYYRCHCWSSDSNCDRGCKSSSSAIISTACSIFTSMHYTSSVSRPLVIRVVILLLVVLLSQAAAVEVTAINAKDSSMQHTSLRFVPLSDTLRRATTKTLLVTSCVAHHTVCIRDPRAPLSVVIDDIKQVCVAQVHNHVSMITGIAVAMRSGMLD